MSDNLKLWGAVEKTNPAYTKKANVKGNKITSIAPQYQVKNATEQFGAYGEKWGFKSIDLDYSMLSIGLVIFKGVFFFPGGEFPIINSIGAYKDNAKTKIDDDFAKKVETDALTKALSKLGFNADIFMGLFDDTRYVNDMMAEFAPTDSDIERIKDAVKNGDSNWIQSNWSGVISEKWAQLGADLQNKLQGK